MRLTIIGAGMQGTAAGYDMARFAGADEIRMLDVDSERAEAAADRINRLVEGDLARPGTIDARDPVGVRDALAGSKATLSAAPYHLNLGLAEAAVDVGSSFGDLGGNTEIVRAELELHDLAAAAGVTVLPDLGLAPGLGNSLAVYAMDRVDSPRSVRIRCGGLPQDPRPPLGYKLVFSVEGLTNEYFGKAVVLRDGRREEIDTFSELETVDFPKPIGRLEAFTTSGGTSTCPWSLAGRIADFDYKTLRYPGHFERMKTLRDMGFLDLEPVEVEGMEVVPRSVFHTLARRALDFPGDRDLVVLRVVCEGDGGSCEIDIIDHHDEETDFSAMERMTAFPASIGVIAMAHGRLAPGAVPLELALDSTHVVDELPRRGIEVRVRRS
ncbi:MAG: hypothetical protein CME06_18445 [Gemmatimonadetes bacterium]|nr:hypothetical protein [Gemmatimonadota bacterium]